MKYQSDTFLTSISQNPLFFFEVGASIAYSYRSEDKQWKLHSPYVGLPLGIGFHRDLSNGMRINPFFRITPFVGKYIGEMKDYWHDGQFTPVNRTVFGGVAPEIGASFNITNHIILTTSISMMWDTSWYSYSRCGQIGLYLGAGYHF